MSIQIYPYRCFLRLVQCGIYMLIKGKRFSQTSPCKHYELLSFYLPGTSEVLSVN